jgi:ankyrin repeat protein
MAAHPLTTFDKPLNLQNAGTAALTDTAALQHMLQTWQTNLSNMAKRAQARAWTCTGPQSDVGMSKADVIALGKAIGEVIPGQLAWAFMQMREWQFEWRANRQDEPRGELSSCYGGGIRGTVWSAEYVIQLEGSLMPWVEMHADNLRDQDQEAQAQDLVAFWQRHLAIHSLPNGDMLTLDLRNDDPQKQPVRYFSHESDGLHGRALAPDFFNFISRWTALGCVGSEWWSWDAFTIDSEPDCSYFDPQSPAAQRWVAWLDKVPAHLSGLALQPDEAPSIVIASSAADFALLTAARSDDMPGVQVALRSGARINCSDEQDWQTENKTAVVYAALNGNTGMLDLLLEHGASLSTHALPLVEVMREAPVAALKWLIEHGARIDPWKDDRFNALHRLYDRDDLQPDAYLSLLDAMLAKGCNPNVFRDIESTAARTTLLMRCGRSTAQRLLAAGADPLLWDLQGRTAMHFVRDAEHVQLLLTHGLDVNDLALSPEPKEADRPLHYNLSSFSAEAPIEIVSALLKHGADPALTDGSGLNAWWYCKHAECALLLQTKLPFDPSWRDASGGSVLHHMIAWSHRIYDHSSELLKYWRAQGLDINAQDADGNTALHAMAQIYDSIHDKPSMVYLLDLGADWGTRNLQGKTPKDLIKKKHRSEWKEAAKR